jgi:hypothetical protein
MNWQPNANNTLLVISGARYITGGEKMENEGR